jgi:nucleoside phosphorylase
MHFGPILSGEKLIDDLDFKNALMDQYPNAIGGEMEGAGLWSAAGRAGKDWILVKGVCDWADGRKNDSFQEMAAASAVSIALHVFEDPHALNGLQKEMRWQGYFRVPVRAGH